MAATTPTTVARTGDSVSTKTASAARSTSPALSTLPCDTLVPGDEREQSLKSAIYRGWVRHRRDSPKRNHFRYPIFMAYLDLDELPQVFARSSLWSIEQRNLVSFRRSDYMGDAGTPLKQAVIDTVEQHTGQRPVGSVRMLTQLRYFGHCFNPVTIYYCFDERDQLQTILAEITNTPWQQRHHYVLPLSNASTCGDMFSWEFPKRFHVSPFIEMQRMYRWRFTAPANRLLSHMQVNQSADGDTELDATLVLKRTPLTGSSMRSILWRFPAMTIQILLRIHIQAAKLWVKKVPFIVHPDKQNR